MAKNKPQLSPNEQFSEMLKSFESARNNALSKLASRDDDDFKTGQLNWWSGKIGSIIAHASQIEENFRRGRYALSAFNDDDTVQAIGNSIRKTARDNLEEIIKVAVTMYYQFCLNQDEAKTKGKR
ncbi:hypothetical protein [Leptospira borgpetersenii]|uniref:hypothetical protein n=1 Tax=Leptospira borgpetersenii TaxID=174 RepID=UPI000347CDB5|nr:hypothetical protein [Leptospira borgpetersenii]URD71570.1 hypothetical protein LIX26_16475 [Leptospira borgpetersenii]UVD74772.1 hypothetical protein NU962_16640 [Leptospira borgpetersenii]UVD77957.1 hypothetical protein LIX27_16710 [Leptospira borgpetersenii]UZW34526.1 hypothetical protein OR565_16715 [Leptospira borgpetersenii]